MIGSIREEGRTRFRKERSPTSIALREDNLIEQLDRRILCSRGFALVNEFVECLGFAQHVHVLAVAVRHTLEESFHVEVID